MYRSHHGPDSPRRKYRSVECCSGVLQCWISDLHVSVPVFRVQGRAVQSGASKTSLETSDWAANARGRADLHTTVSRLVG